MPKLFSRLTIKVDGKEYDTKKGATLDIGGPKRTTQVGTSRVLGFTEEIVPSKVECEIAMSAGLSLDQLRRIENATLAGMTDTGQAYVINGAWVTDPPVLTEGEGTAKVVFEGPPATELA